MEQEQAGGEHAFDHLDVLLIVRFGPAIRSAGAAPASSVHRAAGLRPAGGPKKSRKIPDDLALVFRQVAQAKADHFGRRSSSSPLAPARPRSERIPKIWPDQGAHHPLLAPTRSEQSLDGRAHLTGRLRRPRAETAAPNRIQAQRPADLTLRLSPGAILRASGPPARPCIGEMQTPQY